MLDGTLRRALYSFPSTASCCGGSRRPPAASCRSHRFSSQLAALPYAARFSRLLLVSDHFQDLRASANLGPQKKLAYFRRWTIALSVRLLCRVFLPNVGKAHGVCGWLP